MTRRKRGPKADKAELDKHLTAMFRTLEQRPTPAALIETVDKLEASSKVKTPKG